MLGPGFLGPTLQSGMALGSLQLCTGCGGLSFHPQGTFLLFSHPQKLETDLEFQEISGLKPGPSEAGVFPGAGRLEGCDLNLQDQAEILGISRETAVGWGKVQVSLCLRLRVGGAAPRQHFSPTDPCTDPCTVRDHSLHGRVF